MLERTETGTSPIKTGRVKWFDFRRNYGFMEMDDGTPDAFLHEKILQAGGFRVPPDEGAVMGCEVSQSRRGPEVSKILSLEESWVAAPSPIVKGNNNAHQPNLDRLSQLVAAEVKWFNNLKGYGFLIVKDAFEDVFVHKKTLQQCRIKLPLEEGRMVLVRYGATPQGRLAAAEVRLDNNT